MITPPYLNKGDIIKIISTARKITKSEIQFAVKVLESWGLKVEFGDNLFNAFHQFAGTESERISDLQNALDDERIRAIFCARGGYGTAQLIPHIDFSFFSRNPKWIVGYSDVTYLHSHIQRELNTECIHGSMPVNFGKNTEEALESLYNALFGKDLNYEFPSNSLNRSGTISSKITGGNLSILYSLTGTYSCMDTNDHILFIEELDEYLYHIDRMMMNLESSGLLSGLKALLVGSITDMNDNKVPYGYNAEEIIKNRMDKYDIPVCFNVPVGHINDNRAIVLGREAELIVGSENSQLVQTG